MKKNNQTGFSVVEALLILVVIGILGFTGWYVYHAKQTTGKNYSDTNSASANSNTQASNSTKLGITVKYPSTWTMKEVSSIEGSSVQVCPGDARGELTPGSAELTQAATALKANLKHFTIRIAEYTPQDSDCLNDKANYKGATFAYLQSSDKLTAGLFKGDALTFFGSTIAGNTSSLPDTGIVSDMNYGQPSHAFTDDAMQTYKGATYQIEIITSSASDAQTIAPVPLDVTALKGTQLYADTLAILDSLAG